MQSPTIDRALDSLKYEEIELTRHEMIQGEIFTEYALGVLETLSCQDGLCFCKPGIAEDIQWSDLMMV